MVQFHYCRLVSASEEANIHVLQLGENPEEWEMEDIQHELGM